MDLTNLVKIFMGKKEGISETNEELDHYLEELLFVGLNCFQENLNDLD